jgi:hypothetical protein
MSFKVMVEDNFHYMDPDERYLLGEYETLEIAISACKSVVDSSLKHEYKPGMTADELFSRYKSFGEDPWVAGTQAQREEDVPFSGWKYAKQRCEEICGGSK